MYRSCIFCSAPLGSNESIERFPVGRSLAFDGEKGRLWAVCPKCARWNLAPIEERWEAIEDAERLFRDTRLRVQRENIGLTKLRDGTRLVRIGHAVPGELAAVRYRKPYGRRHTINMAVRVATGTAGALGAIAVGPAIAPVAVPIAVGWLYARDMLEAAPKFRAKVHGTFEDIRTRGRRLVRLPVTARVLGWVGAESPGGAIPLTRLHLFGARLTPSQDGHFAVRLPALDLCVNGWQAQALTARRLVHLTRAGGDERDLAASVRMIATLGGAAGYLDRAARQGMEIGPDAGQHGVQALALEMALHEETERRALEGELAMLEAMWREAEEIASIADRLPDVPASDPPRLTAEG